jgi:hypothetical protein
LLFEKMSDTIDAFLRGTGGHTRVVIPDAEEA